ncbi:hypothetical protein C0Q70_07655 [Pomacea canaliculata]|uniref:DNA endonuclease activator Ctp1 C-terminal domain-containing protein n=3 Tax=Pomacea canaliculata TaxID=400727 RepID=A0A2T7PFM3_POMCA|nr:hypothetical protein C0Q70_07655 [Pomacea canaliculata]
MNRGESQRSSSLHSSDGFNVHSSNTQPYSLSHKNPLDGAPSGNAFLASDENTNVHQKNTRIHDEEKKTLRRRLVDSGCNNSASHLTCDSDASQTVHLKMKNNEVTGKEGEINISVESVKPIKNDLTANKISSAGSKLRLTRSRCKRQHDKENIPDSKRCKVSSINSNFLQEKIPQPVNSLSAPQIMRNTSDTANQKGFEEKVATQTKCVPLMPSKKELKKKESSTDSNKRKVLVRNSDLVSQGFKPATVGDATTFTDCDVIIIPETVAGDLESEDTTVAADCDITVIPETVPGDLESEDSNVSKIHDVQSEYVFEGKEVSKTNDGSSCRFTQYDSVDPNKQVDGTTESIVFDRSHSVSKLNRFQKVISCSSLDVISQEPRPVKQSLSLDIISQEPRPVKQSIPLDVISQESRLVEQSMSLDAISQEPRQEIQNSPVFLGHKLDVDDSPSLFDADREEKKSSFRTTCLNVVANQIDPKYTPHTHSPLTPQKSPDSPFLLRRPLCNIQNCQNSLSLPRPTESMSDSSPSQFKFGHRKLTLGLSKGKTKVSKEDCHDVTLDPNLHQSLLKDVTQDNCTTKTPHCSILTANAEHHNSDSPVRDATYLNDSFDVVPRKSKRPEYAYKEVVRKKDKRRQLNGFTCQECIKYYSSIGLSKKEIAVKANHCSRHRAYYNLPRTPENFWTVGFPDSQECEERGYQK